MNAISVPANGCTSCGGMVLNDGSELVCQDCGLVGDVPMVTPDLYTDGAPSSGPIHRGRIPDTKWVAKYKSNSFRRLAAVARFRDRPDPYRMNVHMTVDQVCAHLDLPKIVRDIAKQMFDQKRRTFRGRSQAYAAAAVVYGAARSVQIDARMQTISSFLGIDRFKAIRAWKDTGLRVPLLTPAHYVAIIARRLNLSREVTNRALSDPIPENLQRQPRIVAAGMIYRAAMISGAPISQNRIADASGCTEVSIRSVLKDLKFTERMPRNR